MSGMVCAPSHLDTACRDTYSLSASSSWDQPFFLRKRMILSARIICFLLGFQLCDGRPSAFIPIIDDFPVARYQPGPDILSAAGCGLVRRAGETPGAAGAAAGAKRRNSRGRGRRPASAVVWRRGPAGPGHAKRRRPHAAPGVPTPLENARFFPLCLYAIIPLAMPPKKEDAYGQMETRGGQTRPYASGTGP